MLNVLTNTLVAILEAYLAVTGQLAAQIESLLPEADTAPQVASTEAPTAGTAPQLQYVESRYQRDLPQILIDTAPPQTATVIDGVPQPQQTDPAANPADAVVNLYCTYETGDMRHAMTGTGFIIHEQGVILTNAHVAQGLILEEVRGNGNCIVRTGNPAEPTYEVELLYISIAWIIEHADELAQTQPKGTGERDFALLYISNGLNNEPAPARFPYLDIYTELLSIDAIGRPVRVTGYPAATVFANDSITAPLTLESADTRVTEMMTFGANVADVFSLSGIPLGEQGVSGSPVTDPAGRALGMISTLGNADMFGSGSLRALTLSYIDRTITAESGRDLDSYVRGDVALRSQLFRDLIVPFLQNVLQDAGVE